MDSVPICMVERYGAYYELRAGGGWYLNGEHVRDPEIVKALDATAGAASVALARGMQREE